MIEDDFLSLYPKQNTKIAYRSAIYSFLECVYDFKRAGKRVTYEEMEKFERLAEQYFSEKRDYANDLMKFASSLNGKPPLTAKVYMAGAKEFLAYNKIDISQRESKNIKSKMPKGGVRTTEDDMDTITIRTIISHMDIKGKALILTLASGGMRISEALNIIYSDDPKESDIHLKEEPPRIDIRGEDVKNGILRYTFISKEAKEALIEWLKVRGKYIEYAVNKSKGKDWISKAENDNRLFPFSDSVVGQMWLNALEKAGLNAVDRVTHRSKLRIQQLRKFFLSQLKLGCPGEIVEALAGHEGYLTDAYRRYTRKQMAEFYIKNEHLLYINMPEDVKQIRNEFKEDLEQTNSIVKNLVLENQNLKQMMDNVRKLLLEEIGLDIAKTDFPQKLEEFRKKEVGIFKITDK